MPASTLDPINAALRSGLANKGAGANDGDLDNQITAVVKKVLLADIEFEPGGSYQSTLLDKLKSKYIVLKADDSPQPSKPEAESGDGETLKQASYELYPVESVQLGWNKCDWSPGAGMINMGNTCYLNSTLQALFHVPAFVNWLMSDKEHIAECENSGSSCIICAVRRTLQESQQRRTEAIRPSLIFNKLRTVGRNLLPGRQEDAHEFLRYLVEAMEKSYLSRFKNNREFDPQVKETTPLNQILGGYLRSAVRCLQCGQVSTTFQHFQDLLLDIRKYSSLEDAMDGFFSQESLDDDSYHCQSCRKKVPATKQFYIERAPMVLCVQLKRFSVTNSKIVKHIQFRLRLDLTRYTKHRSSVPLLYRLVALVTHIGTSVNCGHYVTVAQAPCGNFFQFDDCTVRSISHQGVFSTNAYIMLWELESSPFAHNNKANNTTSTLKTKPTIMTEQNPNNNINTNSNNNNNSNNLPKLSNNNGIGFASDKVYGPELPPDKKFIGIVMNGKKSSSSSSSSSDSSSSGSSDSDQENSSKKENKPLNSNNNYEQNKPLAPIQQKQGISINSQSNIKQHQHQQHLQKQQQLQQKDLVLNKQKELTATPTKLVPYETDDCSSSEEDGAYSPTVTTASPTSSSPTTMVKTKATAEWKVTSSKVVLNEPSSQGKSWDKKKDTVNQLYKLGHIGYTAPVSTWDGTRSLMDKDVNCERREERKRALMDNSDQGRTKHQKTSNSFQSKSNPGYNPTQEMQNYKNTWNSHGHSHGIHSYKYYPKNRNRRFHHKGSNFYKSRYKQ